MIRSFVLAIVLFAATSAYAEDLKSEAMRRCGGVQKCVDGLNNETLDPVALIACFAAINRPSSPEWASNNQICEQGLKDFESAQRRGSPPRR